MKRFLDENFLLESRTAEILYHEYARGMPIIDYHSHLPPGQIASDSCFSNITQALLYGDHYKWRAMRANGVAEEYCTGSGSDYDKFLKWASTVPYTVRNPLFHWTHLELQRYFGVQELLSPATAPAIYEKTSALLRDSAFSVRNLLRKMKVQVVCTTDDPLDDLGNHQRLKESFEVRVLPTFRPDKAMAAENPTGLAAYIDELERVSGQSISNFEDYLSALKSRHDFFAANGCLISDHGLEQLYADDYTDAEITSAFGRLRAGKELDNEQIGKFKSALLFHFARWDHEKGWAQQFHLGALRNNNSRMMKTLGPDTGWDSIGDFSQARGISRFLDRLDRENCLAKTIIYNLNPADNAMIAAMTGNFNDGSIAGKIQFGAAWWFLDQKDGIVEQLNALSNMSLLSRFVGMLTDSRSFLSYPRHEYFRRILCNLLGNDVTRGELPDDTQWLGGIVRDICFNNAKNYFGF